MLSSLGIRDAVAVDVTRRRPVGPAVLALIGGAAIVMGSLLTWVDVGSSVSAGSVAVTGTPKGAELLAGRVALGVGIAIVVFGLLLLAIRSARRLVGILVMICGSVAIAAAVFVAFYPQERYVEFVVDQAAPADQTDELEASVARLFDMSGLEADPGPGLYVVIAGGAIAVIGGLAALFRRSTSRLVSETPDASELLPESTHGEGRPSPAGRPAHQSATIASDATQRRDPAAPREVAPTDGSAMAEVPSEQPLRGQEPARTREPPGSHEPTAESGEGQEPSEDQEDQETEAGFRSDQSWAMGPGSGRERRRRSRWPRRAR